MSRLQQIQETFEGEGIHALSTEDYSWLIHVARQSAAVRACQKEYFKTRSVKALAASKDAERELDKMLGEEEGLFA